MGRPEIYVSTDVETDGPIPGPHSMLSFGSAAFTADGRLAATFSANLQTLPDAAGHPDTMAWWETQPEAWAACRADTEHPESVMVRYRSWLEELPGRPVFVGYPAAFDFMFVYWYLIRFAGSSPFAHSALDLKTYAMALLGTDYRATVKRAMPRRWFGAARHTHVALDDAIEQGELFCAMLAERAGETNRLRAGSA
ncbi:3'-5' exoribonuclease domain-containing protein [Actinoplanes rectilineatus]|uniref:3'-5' exoribonuclease domain-containing protein n=1 Tax=Actinoplanes rectilineatus TaxID=113571 RepID=UPI0005F2D7B7|nr:3'-5' exoribonuclease [Actinoplanes rectilineatus]